MKTLVLLGGKPPSRALLASQLDWAQFVVAADSGIDPLLRMGVEPDVLTGDFDSVEADLSILACRVVRDTSQYATDFEKALKLAAGMESCHILGATGNRHDHLLTNLLIAAGIDPQLEVVLLSDQEVFHRVTPQRALAGIFNPGQTVSLIPFARCRGVLSRGLKWDLSGVDMGIGAQLGQSNIVAGPDINISISEGTLYFVLESDSAIPTDSA